MIKIITFVKKETRLVKIQITTTTKAITSRFPPVHLPGSAKANPAGSYTFKSRHSNMNLEKKKEK
jgi:hypothetical protein